MQNPRTPIQIAIAKTEGTRKRGRPYKRWRDEVEDHLNRMEIKNMQAVARDHQESREAVFEAKVHIGLHHLGRRRILNIQYVSALLGSLQVSVFL
jgi:hypothetical protein